ncbi:MAG: hypothetical protein IPJ88_04800 [Myxococcales bacterium]|nr:MAG: hypothetical protein IPJ88_04800 [Myxococcales bacterium]
MVFGFVVWVKLPGDIDLEAMHEILKETWFHGPLGLFCLVWITIFPGALVSPHPLRDFCSLKRVARTNGAPVFFQSANSLRRPQTYIGVGTCIGLLVALLVIDSPCTLPIFARSNYLCWLPLGVVVWLSLPWITAGLGRCLRRIENFTIKNTNLIADRPVKRANEDRFNREPQIKKLYELIMAHPQESISIGVEGAWGTGKTSFKNLLVEYHKNSSVKNQGDVFGFRPAIFEFKPWHYPSSPRLMAAFFEDLGSELEYNIQDVRAQLAPLLAIARKLSLPDVIGEKRSHH